MASGWPWLALIALGAFHGINPAMGWLFAVALGLQRGERKAVIAALPPIALGHAAAIALAVILVGTARMAVDSRALHLVASACLLGFGVYRLVRGYRHKYRVGMRAGFADLVLWSFLMASAHGAGLMLVPILLELPSDHVSSFAPLDASLWFGLIAVVLHTVAMLVVAGAMAWLIYDWVGLAVLRRGWINLDLLWSIALIGAGAAFLLLAAIGGAGDMPAHRH